MPKKNYSKWTKSAAASMLAFSLVATPYAISFGEGGKPKVSQSAANAAVLQAELLSNMTLTNNSGTTTADRFQLNPDGTQDVTFRISGGSLVDGAVVAGNNKYAALAVPDELVGHVAPNGTATIDTAVTVRIDEVPLVKPVIDAVNSLVSGVATLLDANPVASVNLAGVTEQLDLLNNLSNVGQGAFKTDVVVSPDGKMLYTQIDDGLGLVLAQNLNTILTDLNSAVQAITATSSVPIAGPIAVAAVNAGLAPLKLAVSVAIEALKVTIDAAGEIINQLADAAVLGDTNIDIPVKVTGPVDYLDENPNLDAMFEGSVVKANAIDLALFAGTDGNSTVYYQGNYADFAAENPTDVVTNGNSTDGYIVTGKATPGDTVTVYNANNESVGTGTADANGDFEISLDNTVGPEENLTVKASNEYGESDGVPTETPADLVAPSAPTDVNTTGNSTDGYVVTGKTEPGATVNIYDGDTEVGTGTADADGNFSIEVPGSVGPEKDLTVKAENGAGEGEGATTTTPADPAVAPSAPTDVNTTGNSTDGYVVTGKTEPGATVNIYDGDTEVGTGTADADGNFSIDVPGSVGPEKDLTVKAENGAGEGEGATTTTPADPAVAPSAPTDVNTTGNSTDGYVVTGKTEPGATVNIYDGDTEVGTGTADADGNFSIDVPGSVGPEKELTVKAENGAGEGEGATTTTPADEAPPVELPAAPSDVATTGNSTDGYEVKGKAEPGSTVKVYDGDTEVGSGEADADGNFTITLPGSIGPEKPLTVTATNSAGEGPAVDTATPADETPPVEAPGVPVIGTVTGNPVEGYVVIGETAPNASVTIYDSNNNEVGTGTADENGKFEVNVPGSVGPNAPLTVQVSNEGGTNQAEAKTPKLSGAITVNSITEPSTIITGSAPLGTQRVLLNVNGKDLSWVAVNEDGTFQFERKYVPTKGDISKQKVFGEGDEVTVSFYGKGGEEVTAGTTVVQRGEVGVVFDAAGISVDPTTGTITAINGYIEGYEANPVSRVVLSINGRDLEIGDVNPDGTFQFNRKYYNDNDGNRQLLKAGDEVKVSIYDAGKRGIASTTTVAGEGVVGVTIAGYDKASGVISGTTDPRIEKVQLTINGINLSVATVDPETGAYSFTRKYYKDQTGNTQKIKAGDIIEVSNYSKTTLGDSASYTVPAD